MNTGETSSCIDSDGKLIKIRGNPDYANRPLVIVAASGYALWANPTYDLGTGLASSLATQRNASRTPRISSG